MNRTKRFEKENVVEKQRSQKQFQFGNSKVEENLALMLLFWTRLRSVQ